MVFDSTHLNRVASGEEIEIKARLGRLSIRMLVAQAQVEGLALISRDTQVARYDVEVVW